MRKALFFLDTDMEVIDDYWEIYCIFYIQFYVEQINSVLFIWLYNPGSRIPMEAFIMIW